MHLVPTAAAVFAGLAVLVLPGLGLLLWLRREEHAALRFDEKLFLVPATSVMIAAWVSLLLAEMGHCSLVTTGLVCGGVGVALGGVGLLRREGLSWPRPHWTSWAPFAGILVLALALQTRPSEYVVGGRDPGTYVAAMGLIGRTGGVVYSDPLVAALPAEDVALFFRNPKAPDFSWARFMGFPLESPRTGRVFPEFFHLFPAFGALLFQAMGVKGALATPCLFGVLGTLACFLALQRILGTVPAVVAAALLALNVLQVWFARYPVSEPMSQFLIWTGLLALWHWEARSERWAGVMAGVAFGLSLFVRIDSALIVAPIGLYVWLRLFRGEHAWRHLAAFLVPLGALAAHAVTHATVWAWKYTHDIVNRPYWRASPFAWVLVLLAGAALLFAARPLGRWLAPWGARHENMARTALAVLILLAATYAYFLRPLLSAWAGADGNLRDAALADGVARTLLDQLGFRRLAAHDAQAFLRLGWFVHPLGLAMATLGMAGLVLRGRRAQLFFLLCTLSFSAFYFYKLRVNNDYFFAARRFVPVILPSALGCAAWALVECGRRVRALRRALVVVGLLLAGLFVRDTARIARHVDWQGMVGFTGELGRMFGPRSVVVFEQQASIHLLSLPLWSIHGTPVLELARWDPDPTRLEHVVRAWRAAGLDVYFAYTYRAERGLCGLFLKRTRDFAFGTKEWEFNYAGPPTRAVPRAFRFTVARVVLPEEVRVPPLADLDVGGTDEFQVSGFFPAEGAGERTYRWTGPCASLLLPTLPQGRAVVLVASAAQRPTPARVQVSIGGRAIAVFLAPTDWAPVRIALPADRPASSLLRLSVSTWRPENVAPESDDVRDLGIMVDRVWVEPGEAQEPRP